MQKIQILPWVYVLDSRIPWKTTTIMAWVHGNETSGIRILEKLADTLDIVSGKVYLVLQANPRAVSAGVRQTEKNMNRAFHDMPQGSTYEDLRAQEILPILRDSDILLDVHNTLSTENSVPFLISEHSIYDTYFPVDTVVSGLDILHPGGSDGYMNSIWKVWLCIEVGSIYFHDDGHIARQSILSLLSATGNIATLPIPTYDQKKYILDTIVYATSTDFRFSRKWADFEPIYTGEIIWYDGNMPVYAPYDGVIVFSYLPTRIGDEVCVFGRVR
jgi:succinylglutamate desuccinylase